MCEVDTCTRCKKEKPFGHFSTNRGKRRGVCRQCIREHAKRRRDMQKVAEKKPENFDIGLQFNRWRWPSAVVQYW
jgi:hypothetical protein